MNDFELPSNIKQIGVITDGLRIYIEDYVHTYLKQYADSGGHNEKQAFLIGKHMVIDNQPYLFISGAIQGRYCEFEDGVETFSEKSFADAQEQIDTYFEGYEIVGWMQSQPGYGIILNQAYADFHMSNFTKQKQVMFVIDPVERVNCFFAWNEDLTGLHELKGYIIYYDKNPGMQEYMLDNKVTRMTVRERAVMRDSEKSERTESKRRKTTSGAVKEKDYGSAPSEKSEKDTGNNNEYKKVVNMLVSLSAVLFVICFIMGAGLIQNDGRINKLERSFTALDSAYSYLLTTANKSNTQDVFAASGSDERTEGTEIYEGEIKDDTILEVAEDGTADSIIQSQSESEGGELTEASEPPAATENAEQTLATAEPAITPSTSTPTPIPTVDPTQEPVSTAVPTVEPANVSVAPPVENNTVEIGGALVVPETYVVQKGDNLNYISSRFYGSTDMVAAIMELNGMDDPNKIYFGKVLLLPDSN